MIQIRNFRDIFVTLKFLKQNVCYKSNKTGKHSGAKIFFVSETAFETLEKVDLFRVQLIKKDYV